MTDERVAPRTRRPVAKTNGARGRQRARKRRATRRAVEVTLMADTVSAEMGIRRILA
jgi:hypothetical protein